ncbi:MAG: cob(I)yrinic acid a,c-diamide adenosyltransferase [Bacteroidota bacterium]|nr:cob(I)yrinic acid a,c-diamide adenosyltransferase [Bacteroidota bacterium]
MKLYTKTGDKGQTGLIGGTRVPKNDIRIEAYGTVDELNSFIGMLTTYPIADEELLFLRTIQHNLFTVGSYLATDTTKVSLQQASILRKDSIEQIEQEIDRIDAMLPTLNSFVLPGGSRTGALSHVCRTIARRAERRLFDVNEFHLIDNEILVYFNRLSDYFFALSRAFTLKDGGEEIYWKKHD